MTRVLGLDLQPDVASLAIADTAPLLWPPRTISDASAPAFVRDGGDLTELLERIAPRVRATIGPDRAVKVHRLTVVLPAGAGEPALETWFQASGLAAKAAQIRLMSACRALLVAATGVMAGELEPACTVAVVALGDRGVEVQSFRLARGGEWLVATQADEAQILVGCGASNFAEAALTEVMKLLPPEPKTADAQRRLLAAARELGPRLADAAQLDPRAPVPWIGPLAEALPGGVSFTAAGGEAWPPTRRLAQWLPQVLLRSKADLIVVGGSGARWPFAGRIAAGVGTSVVLPQPHLALARGAACWNAAKALFPELDENMDPGLPEPRRPPQLEQPADLNRLAALSRRQITE